MKHSSCYRCSYWLTHQGISKEPGVEIKKNYISSGFLSVDMITTIVTTISAQVSASVKYGSTSVTSWFNYSAVAFCSLRLVDCPYSAISQWWVPKRGNHFQHLMVYSSHLATILVDCEKWNYFPFDFASEITMRQCFPDSVRDNIYFMGVSPCPQLPFLAALEFSSLGKQLATSMVSSGKIWLLGPQIALPGWRVAGGRWAAHHQDGEVCFWWKHRASNWRLTGLEM